MDIAVLLDLPRGPGETTTAPAGFAELDALVGGFKPGSLTLVTSTPGQGRTTLLTQWAGALAVTQGWTTVLVCPRDTPQRCATRLIAGLSGVPLHHLAGATMDSGEQESARRAEVALRASKLVVGAGPRSQVPLLREAHPMRAYVIDDVDLIEECSPKYLRALADQGAVVIASLPRHLLLEGKETDADLEHTWARAADLIIEMRTLATRGVDGHPSRGPGTAEFSILKNRHGPLIQFAAANQCWRARFADLTPEQAARR